MLQQEVQGANPDAGADMWQWRQGKWTHLPAPERVQRERDILAEQAR